MPSNILVIGATSAIAQAYARREAAGGAHVFLVARDAARLETISADLRVRGAGAVHSAVLDVVDDAAQDRVLDAAWAALGRVDVALLAHGTLPDQARCEADPAYARAEFETNGGATIALMTRLAPIRDAAPAIWPFVEDVIEEAFTTGRYGAPYPWEEQPAT